MVGTRPEAIKMAPVILAIRRRPHDFEQVVAATGQHRDMLDQVLTSFDIAPDVDLDLMHHDHRIGSFAGRAMGALTELFLDVDPDVILVQGDTTTVLCASLAAFWLQIPLGHVEAGLRSHDRSQPFPEELNREVAGLAAHFHFAPTPRARDNLLRERVAAERIFVTGNPIVDALAMMQLDVAMQEPALAELDVAGRRTILVTAHRRENHGAPLIAICRALRKLVERFEDVQIVLPVHLNPHVDDSVRRELAGTRRILLTPPLAYDDLLRVMSRAHLILTDSGGIQEEAPSFRKPVLVLREVTERPEAVEAGMSQLVGTDSERIVECVSELLGDDCAYRAMAEGPNPFGDGRAGERIAEILRAQVVAGERSR